ncbi:hypothetical protein Gocc_2670 [Gaiella occulta]|uniref:Uncharacterized protein n=2 Tax=Gaiella occulta TaxID=1002870 RepID=A0A7M2YVB2_9ACTN|nr:hypothetical protein Gocc_2670 [Gaiella occulta]
MSELVPYGDRDVMTPDEIALLRWDDDGGAVDPLDDEPIEMGSMQWLSDPVSIEVGVDVVQWPAGGRAA